MFKKRIIIENAHIMDPSDNLDLPCGELLINSATPDSDGRVSAIGLPGTIARQPGDIVIDARGMVVAPGLVDIHVHLRDPGQTQKEDIITGCRAAAAGGVTSLVCMPNTAPTIDCAEVVEYVRKKAEGADAHVYIAGAVTKSLAGQEMTDFATLKAAGAWALSDDGKPVRDNDILSDALKTAAELDMPLLYHAEYYTPVGALMREGEVSQQLGVVGIPAEAEFADIHRAALLAQMAEAPIHICHVSCAQSFEVIRQARELGCKITCETAPHYFALTDEMLLSRDADYRMNPPLESEEDRLAVIAAIKDGTVSAIATDHAPHTPEEKANFETSPNGVIGMETSLAATWTYLKDEIPLMQILRLMSTNPANILGINAGSLSANQVADVIIFDPDECWTVDVDKLHGKSRNAVFKGMQLCGRVKLTILGGEIKYIDGGMENVIRQTD